jgi:hypothetical protein
VGKVPEPQVVGNLLGAGIGQTKSFQGLFNATPLEVVPRGRVQLASEQAHEMDQTQA